MPLVGNHAIEVHILKVRDILLLRCTGIRGLILNLVLLLRITVFTRRQVKTPHFHSIKDSLL